jgi:hypothetical protein
MNRRTVLALVCACVLAAFAANRSAAAVITRWGFPTMNTGPINSPAPDVGSGTASVLGMDNHFTFSSNNVITGSGTFTPGTIFGTVSTASADILGTSGDPNGFLNAWRVRGPSNNQNGVGGLGNGWDLAAPQYSQGAQFSVSTSGFTNITFHADWFTTTQGVRNLQVQYTTNGTSWTNIGPLLVAVSNGFEQINQDFTGVAGVANDPNFGVRLVSAYDPTLTGINAGNYGSADGQQAGVYNNNSGNWRFADVTVSGTVAPAAAVPEPSSLLLCGLAGLALAGVRRRGR